MTLGTVWVTLCALLVLKQRRTPSKSSGPLIWLLGLFAWGWLSLLWSDNLDWGLQLASIQVTLLTLAFSWHVVPRPDLTAKWVFQSAALAMAGVLAWGAWRVGQGEVLAGRDWTPWTSHIRLAMLAALGWVWGAQHQSKTSIVLFGALWAFFTAVTGSLTNALLWPLALIWVLWGRFSPSARRGLLAGSAAITLTLAGGMALWLRPVPLPVPRAELPAFTAQGHAYIHHPERVVSEGGHRLHLFLCPTEWEDAWSQISDLPLHEPNAAGFTVRDRLPRYLTSLGWPKDGEHILQLSPKMSGPLKKVRRTLLLRKDFGCACVSCDGNGKCGRTAATLPATPCSNASRIGTRDGTHGCSPFGWATAWETPLRPWNKPMRSLDLTWLRPIAIAPTCSI